MNTVDHQLLGLLLDASDVGVIVVGPDGCVMVWNQWMERAADLPRDEAAGRRLDEIFPELAGTRIPRAVDSALSSGLASLLTPALNRRMFPLIGRDREPMEQVVVVKPLAADGGPGHCFIQINDITQATARERMLRQQARTMEALAENYRLSEMRTRAIVDNALDAIITFDETGRIVTYNPAAERVFGHPADHMMGKSVDGLLRWREVQRDDEAELQTLWQRLAEDRGIHECTGLRGGDREVALEFSLGRMELDGRPLYVATARDISSRKQAEARIQYLAHYDSLTDLPNRVLFQERLTQAMKQARRTRWGYALLMLDLDRFKEVNDTLGHHVGDALLAAAAGRIAEAVRESDTVARLGGDEFAVLLTNLAGPEDAGKVAAAINANLAQPFQLDGHEVKTSGSIGIAVGDGLADEDREDLLKRADLALYRSKAKGRNTYEFYVPQMDALVQAHKGMERELRDALEADGLMLYYQPMVDARSGAITGAEALIRWNHRDRGPLEAHEFIPVVRDTDLIVPLGHWVIRQSLHQARLWRDAGFPDLRVAINLAPAELYQPGFLAGLEQALADTGLPPSVLQLEIGEDALLVVPDRAPGLLEGLRERGVRLSIDDFGTGVSSLDYLKRHPVDELKIAPSFLRKVQDTAKGGLLFQALVELAHGLDASVDVEGVETRDQMLFARHVGAEELQGFFLAAPMPAEALTRLMARREPLIDAALES